MKALAASQKQQLQEECSPELELKRLSELTAANATHEATLAQLEKEVAELEGEGAQLDEELQKVETEWKAMEEEQEEEGPEEEEHNEMMSWVEKVQEARGLPQQRISELLTMEWEGGEDEICLSCYAGLEHGSEVTYLPCSHLFHKGCISSHLRLNRFCPACQQTVV